MRTRTLFVAAAALALAGTVGTAQAGPLGVTGASVTIYHYTNAGGLQTDPCEQALPVGSAGGCSAANAGPAVYTGAYTGPINFIVDTGNPSIATFLASAGGTFTPTVAGLTADLSHPGFTVSTLMDFIFTPSATSITAIDHDDGISIWNSTNTVELFDSSAPTNEITSNFTFAAGTTYSLWYAEVNGTPAELATDFTSPVGVPEPGSLVLFGTGLIALGLLRRRHKTAA